MIPIDDVVFFDVTTHVAATGAVSDADSAPTFAVYEEDTDTAIVTGTTTKRTSLTGNYRGTFTASAANGFEAGKWYTVIVSATVSSVSAKCVAKHFRVAPAENSAGVPLVDVSRVAGTAQTARDLGGQLDAAVSTRLASASYTAPLDAAGTRTAVGLASANLDTQLADLPTNAELATALAAADDAVLAAIAALNIPTAAQNAAALLDYTDGVETSLTPRGAIRLMVAALAGKLSGAATTTITVRNVGDTKARITATVDSDGNRSAVTTDAT